MTTSPEPALADERDVLAQQINDGLEKPMLVLAFVWLALFVVEVVWGLGPFLEAVGLVIWAVFVIEFGLGLWVAPRKGMYIRRNWLKGIALVAPALRVLRIVRLVRLARLARLGGAARGLRLVRVVSTLNRGMRALGATMRRRGVGYVLALTGVVTIGGAAGMYAFERAAPGERGLHSFGEALWWTAMSMTTMGSEYWPQSAEGRALCLGLALYAFGVFGYVTATLSSFFIGRDADDETAEVVGAKDLAALRAELAALTAEIRIGRQLGGQPGPQAGGGPGA